MFKKIFTTLALLTATIAQAQTQTFVVMSPNEIPESSAKIAINAKPGTTHEAAFHIFNLTGNQTANLTLTPVNLNLSNDGSYGFETNDQPTPNSPATWIQLNQTELTLNPREQKIISFKLTPPENQPPGAYLAGISAQEKSTINTTKPGVKIQTRTVEPIYINIPGKRIVDYKTEDLTITQTPDKIIFSQTSQNRGTNLLKIYNTVKINNLNNETIRTINLPTSFLLNNEQKTTWAETPNDIFGTYKIELIQQIKDYNFETNRDQLIETITKSQTQNFYQLQSILKILLLTAIIITITILTNFKRHSNYLHSTQIKVKKGQTLQQIAKQTNTTWQALAKTNHLKKPYTLKPNQILTIPKPKKK